MDKKVALQVLNITNSQAQVGAYAMLLGEVDGKRQLPIIIGPAEAQSTALYLKGVKTPRPLTHELFTTCLNTLGCTLLRALIYKVKEGVFYSYIYLRREEEIIRIDARTSDAIALAIRSDAPIYIYESILELECLHINPGEIRDTDDEEEEEDDGEAFIESMSTMPLDEELQLAIEREDYERAAWIRDQIRQQKK